MLVGRERELQAIDGAIAAAGSGKSTALLLVGDPGIGKSTLLAAARDQAVASGLQILTAHGVEAERNLAYGGLVELLSPVAATLAELPETQRSALATALALEHGPAPGRFAVSAAVLGLVSLLAERHGQVYRKLGVRSRTELARELAPTVAAEPPGLEATMVAE